MLYYYYTKGSDNYAPKCRRRSLILNKTIKDRNAAQKKWQRPVAVWAAGWLIRVEALPRGMLINRRFHTTIRYILGRQRMTSLQGAEH